MRKPQKYSLLAGLILLTSIQQANAADTSKESLDSLIQGNARYMTGKSTIPRIDPERREITATKGQFPIATILGCSDARVPPEIIFDQKFGKLFIIRVAGNITGESEIASAEYGVHYLKTPLLVVLGHSSCGAVQAAVDNAELKGKLPKLISMIQPAVDEAKKNKSDYVEENVRYQMKQLLAGSDVIKEAVKAKTVKVVGAVRDIKTGKVTWLK